MPPNSPTAIRRAFVLGAGLGTRLRPLTANCPKPLIPVCNQPLITFAFDQLLAASRRAESALAISEFIVNTHHSAKSYQRTFPGAAHRGIPLQFRHEPDLLETGGGIKNVEDLLGDEPFIVFNGDILTDLPLEKAARHHLDSGNEITLVLRSVGEPQQVAFDEASGRITDIRNRLETGHPHRSLFTGIYCVSPEFLRRIPAKTKISVIPIFLNMIRQNEKIGGIVIDDGHWWDLGTREQYLAVHRQLHENPPAAFRDLKLTWIHPTAQIAPDAEILGATAIGTNAQIDARASLTDCIVWDGAKIAEGSVLTRCVISANHEVNGTHADTDFAS